MMFDDFTAGQNFNDGKIYGVVLAVVTNNKDPKKLGRVKVKLSLRECETETDWARITTLMSGKQMGTFFLPEVGDEVLVAFNRGDINEPFVIGSLWNSKEKPPENNSDGKNNIRVIKSRSGHIISFDDKSGKEKITIKTKKGNKIILDDASNGKVEVQDKSGKNKLTLDGSKKQATLEGSMKLTLKSSSCQVVIDGTKKEVQIKSDVGLKIKSTKIDVEATSMLNLKSSGIVTIKGSLVKIN